MEKYTKICPHCNSVNVAPDISKEMIAWGGSTNMKCDDCGFSSSFFPEAPVDKLGNIHLKKRTHEDVKEVMSSKGVHKGKPWGWLLLVTAMITLLLSFVDEYWFIILAPSSLFQLILGILMIRMAKRVKD